MSRYQGAPTQTQIDQFNNIKNILDPFLEKALEMKEKDIPELNKLLNGIQFPILEIKD